MVIFLAGHSYYVACEQRTKNFTTFFKSFSSLSNWKLRLITEEMDQKSNIQTGNEESLVASSSLKQIKVNL